MHMFSADGNYYVNYRVRSNERYTETERNKLKLQRHKNFYIAVSWFVCQWLEEQKLFLPDRAVPDGNARHF
jgi:hypothetical protein